MYNQDIEIDHNDFAQLGYQIPFDAEIIYSKSFSDWSWGCTLIVYQIGSNFFVIEESGGYGEDFSSNRYVSQEEALRLMIEFEEECV